MESGINIMRLTRELARVAIMLEEHQRYLSYKDLGSFRAKTEGHKNKTNVDQALDLISTSNKQLTTLEGLCLDMYNTSIERVKLLAIEGQALVELYHDEVSNYFKAKKTYEILKAADAFDESGEYPEESREGYEETLLFMEQRLYDLSQEALKIIPLHNREE